MELEEIKTWVNKNVSETTVERYNMKKAFLLIIDAIYQQTEDKIENIEKFYLWFKEKWDECYSIISEHPNLQYLGQLEDGRYMYVVYTDYRTCEMLFKNYIKNLFNINITLWKGIACEPKFFDEPQHFLN